MIYTEGSLFLNRDLKPYKIETQKKEKRCRLNIFFQKNKTPNCCLMLQFFGFYFNILHKFENVGKLGGLEKEGQIQWTNPVILMTKAAKTY
jgi:hypothetical protein